MENGQQYRGNETTDGNQSRTTASDLSRFNTLVELERLCHCLGVMRRDEASDA
jgi:hypothetical protein